MKKDTTALNIRIDTSLYNLLQDATKTGQSKTYLVENALRCYLNVESSTDTDETESDRASLEHTVQNLTKEIEHLKGIVKPQEELLEVTGTDKPRPTASLNSPKSFGFAVHSLLKEAEESMIDLDPNEDKSPIDLPNTTEEESSIDLSSEEVGESSIATGDESLIAPNDEPLISNDDDGDPEPTEEELEAQRQLEAAARELATPDREGGDDDEDHPNTEKLEPLSEDTPLESTLEETKATFQDDLPLSTPETLKEAKTEESLVVTVLESQVYLIQLKNDDKKPTELVRGFDFSCETDDPSDLMEAINGFLYDNDFIDPDDEDVNVRIWDDPKLWKKANKGRGLFKAKMAKKIGVAPNTITACMNDKASEANQKLYENQVARNYFWCHLTKRFYRR